MPEQETPGQFDYLWENLGAEQERDADTFDAFAPGTWVFKPAPPPWYRTRRAVIALSATGVAAVAIVVSAVLLLLRGGDSDEPQHSTPTTTPSSVAPEPSLRIGVPPAPPPPAAPPPEEARPSTRIYRPTQRPHPTKKPEIGVTRTPETRKPISVAPKPHPPRG